MDSIFSIIKEISKSYLMRGNAELTCRILSRRLRWLIEFAKPIIYLLELVIFSQSYSGDRDSTTRFYLSFDNMANKHAEISYSLTSSFFLRAAKFTDSEALTNIDGCWSSKFLKSTLRLSVEGIYSLTNIFRRI
jgi:hypothetical protein